MKIQNSLSKTQLHNLNPFPNRHGVKIKKFNWIKAITMASAITIIAYIVLCSIIYARALDKVVGL